MADPTEQALADGAIEFEYDEAGTPYRSYFLDEAKGDLIEHDLQLCREPGSMRFDPYAQRDGRRPPYESWTAVEVRHNGGGNA